MKMSDARICDECGEVYREEGKWCKNDEINFSHKIYHVGEGMHYPWKETKVSFCSMGCFRVWFHKKYKMLIISSSYHDVDEYYPD